MEETSTEAMVDTSATGDFIDQDFVTQEKLPTRKLSQLVMITGNPRVFRISDLMRLLPRFL